MSLNKVMLIGNAGKDPEIRYIGEAGNSYKSATFSLATTEKYKDRSGNVKENTEWHNIAAFRSTADIIEKYVKKGTQVFIEGKIKTRVWDDNNGVRRYNTDIIAERIQLLGGKPSEERRNVEGARQLSQEEAARRTNAETNYSAPAPVVDMADDDLPF